MLQLQQYCSLEKMLMQSPGWQDTEASMGIEEGHTFPPLMQALLPSSGLKQQQLQMQEKQPSLGVQLRKSAIKLQ